MMMPSLLTAHFSHSHSLSLNTLPFRLPFINTYFSELYTHCKSPLLCSAPSSETLCFYPPLIPVSMSSLCLLFLLIFPFTPTHSFHRDRLSLLAFKNLITSDPHHSMADWSPANPFCNWTGVTCVRRHPNRVASLNLTEMDLRGSISPLLGNLSFLRSLDLSGNALTGHIPPQLGRLFRLRELSLDNNGLEGNIPNNLGSCRNLTYVALSYNNLNGNIPREFGSLPHLQKLYLGENDLTGAIPSSLGNLSSLIHLTLEGNSLTGSIPSQLSSCRNLTLLLLALNELTGTCSLETDLSVPGTGSHLVEMSNTCTTWPDWIDSPIHMID